MATKTTYGKEDLREFKTIIDNKLEKAREELKYLASVNNQISKNIKVEGFLDVEPSEMQTFVDRQNEYIKKLEDALDRIKNKTYGKCVETGKLIDKARLVQVPHALVSIEVAKKQGAQTVGERTVEDICEAETPYNLQSDQAVSALTTALQQPTEEPADKPKVRTCRVCGCTDDNCEQCIEKTGSPCHWVEEDLCSACVEPERTGTTTIEIADKVEEPVLSTSNEGMTFFQKLAAEGLADLTMSIKEKDGTITMTVSPGSGSARFKPINVRGTPAELDEGFFSTLAPGIKEIQGMVTNLDEVKKDVKAEVEKKETATAQKKKKWKRPEKKPAVVKKKRVPPVKKPAIIKKEKPPTTQKKSSTKPTREKPVPKPKKEEVIPAAPEPSLFGEDALA